MDTRRPGAGGPRRTNRGCVAVVLILAATLCGSVVGPVASAAAEDYVPTAAFNRAWKAAKTDYKHCKNESARRRFERLKDRGFVLADPVCERSSTLASHAPRSRRGAGRRPSATRSAGSHGSRTPTGKTHTSIALPTRRIWSTWPSAMTTATAVAAGRTSDARTHQRATRPEAPHAGEAPNEPRSRSPRTTTPHAHGCVLRRGGCGVEANRLQVRPADQVLLAVLQGGGLREPPLRV